MRGGAFISCSPTTTQAVAEVHEIAVAEVMPSTRDVACGLPATVHSMDPSMSSSAQAVVVGQATM
ncbi:MAG TPA: hypothetical protein VG650_04945 [Mycobacteriales bacterium]|nr:hypothetical protein [Mycobacteriales bacterium]HWC34157.1 hypothetical protein [Mycobacteriales bacterium]